MSRLCRRLAHAVSIAALLLFARPAMADAGQCIASFEHAQELKNAGKLTAARDELVACSRQECPKLVQDDCNRWMAQVLTSLPSIIPAAKDEAGHDVIEAKFFVDNKLVTSTFDGKPVAVDPGVHTLRFERGEVKQEERVSIKAGEQNRIISVTLNKPVPVEPPPPPPGPSSDTPVLPIVVGAAGVVIGALSLAIDLKATGDAHDLRSSCAPNCVQDDVDSIHRRYVFAGIGGGIAVAALVVAGVLYWRTKRSDVGLNVMQGRVSF